MYVAPQLPYGRAGFVRVNLSGAAGDVDDDFDGGLNGGVNGDLSGVFNGGVSGEVSGGTPLGALLTQLRHEALLVRLRHGGESGGAFAAVVLGGADPNT